MKAVKTTLSTAVIAVIAVAVGAAGCASFADEERPGDPQELQEEVRSFHTNLRWARYRHAADSVHPAYRATFEGVYEERGDDYEIVDMSMETIEIVDEGFTAHVEVEQSWYELPSTVVESENYVERWIYENEKWQLRERLTRDEFRELDEVFPSAETDEDTEGGTSDDTAETTSR